MFTSVHNPCGNCGSSDALALNEDGSSKCFSCGTFEPAKNNKANESDNSTNRTVLSPRASRPGTKLQIQDIDLSNLSFETLRERKIKKETCIKYGYKVDKLGNHYAPYHKGRELVAMKKRKKVKGSFPAVGTINEADLFGQNTCPDKGRRLVITEGELDCLSVSQVFGNSWPVVSIHSASTVERDIKKNYDFITSFDEIVLAFDADKPGEEATKKALDMLPSGQAKVLKYPQDCKDANDILVKYDDKTLVYAVLNAAVKKQDGIVLGSELIDDLKKHYDGKLFTTGLDICFPRLSEIMRGVRKGELVTFAGGTGTGKSTLVHSIGYDLVMNHGKKVAIIALEEIAEFAALRYVSIHTKHRLHLDVKSISRTAYNKALKEVLGNDNLMFYKHDGHKSPETLLERITYFARAMGVDFIIYDHISMAIAGEKGGDERRMIDNAITDLRSVIDSTGVGCLLISHVRKSGDSKSSAEEGGRITVSDLRGSACIAQESDFVIGIERNLQDQGSSALIRVLKNRLTGETGPADNYVYNKETGCITVADMSGLESAQDDFEGHF